MPPKRQVKRELTEEKASNRLPKKAIERSTEGSLPPSDNPAEDAVSAEAQLQSNQEKVHSMWESVKPHLLDMNERQFRKFRTGFLGAIKAALDDPSDFPISDVVQGPSPSENTIPREQNLMRELLATVIVEKQSSEGGANATYLPQEKLKGVTSIASLAGSNAPGSSVGSLRPTPDCTPQPHQQMQQPQISIAMIRKKPSMIGPVKVVSMPTDSMAVAPTPGLGRRKFMLPKRMLRMIRQRHAQSSTITAGPNAGEHLPDPVEPPLKKDPVEELTPLQILELQTIEIIDD